MANDRGSNFLEVTLSFLVGTATGFILGILFAPASGEETRKKIQESAAKTTEKAKEGYEKIAKEAEKGIKIVKEKTQEGVEVIKDFVEKKREELSKKTPPELPKEAEKK
jgi:gas vesicle protein